MTAEWGSFDTTSIKVDLSAKAFLKYRAQVAAFYNEALGMIRDARLSYSVLDYDTLFHGDVSVAHAVHAACAAEGIELGTLEKHPRAPAGITPAGPVTRSRTGTGSKHGCICAERRIYWTSPLLRRPPRRCDPSPLNGSLAKRPWRGVCFGRRSYQPESTPTRRSSVAAPVRPETRRPIAWPRLGLGSSPSSGMMGRRP